MNLALGTAQLGMDYGIANQIGQPSVEKAFEILDMAARHNYLWLDTAPGYGKSQQIIGEYFGKHKKSPLKLVTKIPSMADLKTDEEAAEHIRNHFQNSWDTLKPASPEVLLLHDPKDYERFGTVIRESFARIRSLYSNLHFGISLYDTDQLVSMQDDETFDAFQIPFNIFDHRYIKLVKDKKIKPSTLVFIRSVYLQGLFFADTKNIEQRVPDAVPFLQKFHEIISSHKVTVQEACLGFVKKHIRHNDCIVIGADSAAHVQKNAEDWQRCEIADDLHFQIAKLFGRLPEAVINPVLWGKID